MFYFVPNWENEVREATDDAMTNLVDMFSDNKESIEIIVLRFFPELQHFLNENDLLDTRFWSVWDEILNVKRTDGMPITVNDLELPSDADIVYSTYSIVVEQNSKLFAKIQLTTQGYIRSVQFVPDANGNTKVDNYDDRGFKITTEVRDAAMQRIQQTWWNEQGQAILEENNHQIKVVGNQDNFEMSEYQNEDQLVSEFVRRHLEEVVQEEDYILASTDPTFSNIMNDLTQEFMINLILDNSLLLKFPDFNWASSLHNAEHVFVENTAAQQKLINDLGSDTSVKVERAVFGFTELLLGNSNEEDRLMIYWELDNTTTAEDRRQTLETLYQNLFDKEQIGLVIEADSEEIASQIVNQIVTLINDSFANISFSAADIEMLLKGSDEAKEREILGKLIMQLQQTLKQFAADKDFEMPDLDHLITILMNVRIRITPNLFQIEKDFDLTRLVISMGSTLNSLKQLRAISFGVPVIIQTESELIVNRKNGWLVSAKQSLQDGLSYYLDLLQHWNESLVYDVALLNQFESDKQINWWKERLQYGTSN